MEAVFGVCAFVVMFGMWVVAPRVIKERGDE
jgi:phosphate/sulfate permease